MQYIYVSNSRIPTEKAHGIQIMEMCHAFSILGINLKLIIPSRKNSLLKNIDPFEYYKLSKNFKIKKINTIDPVFLLKFTKGLYIKVQGLFFVISLFFYFIFSKHKKDKIIYTRDEYLLPVLQLFFKEVYWEAHNLPKNTWFYKKYWKKLSGIITINNRLKEDLVRLGLNGDAIFVSPDGVNLDKFLAVTENKTQLRKKLLLPSDKNLIIYIGHLYDWKGVQVLAEAAKFLDNDTVIIFIGGTDQDIANFKEINKNIKNILILGRKNHDQIPMYLKSADVLVLPNSAKYNISKFYTSPLKLFEYMTAQLPIVASNLPSIREILNKENAVLVSPDDSYALACGIQIVLQNTSLADKISKKSIEDIKLYSWEKRAKNIINFMQ